MGMIISLLNHKGGVGKTTSAINIGAGLVELGKRVMLVDLDPQANLTLSLGIPRQKSTIYEALRGVEEMLPYTAKEGLDVVTSSLDLSGAEMELINEAGREYLLRELFEPFLEDYDYIIIDCPPSLGLLTLNALTCSHQVLIPLQTEFLALQGLTKIKQVIDKVRFRLNKNLEIGGVIATMYDQRKVLNRDVVQTIRKFFGPKVFNTLIRDNVALAEAPAQRKDIFGYNKASNGAKDYLALCKEIIERTAPKDEVAKTVVASEVKEVAPIQKAATPPPEPITTHISTPTVSHTPTTHLPLQSTTPTPVQETAPIQPIIPVQETTPTPVQETAPIQPIIPVQETTPIQPIMPVQETTPIQEVTPVQPISTQPISTQTPTPTSTPIQEEPINTNIRE